MKILIISHFFSYPFLGGGGKRFQNIIKPLQERHDITWVTFIYNKEDEKVIEAFRNEWHKVEIITVPYPENQKKQNFSRLNKIKWLLNPLARPVAFSLKMKETVERLIKTRSYDMVQFDYAQTGQYLPPSSPPSILVEHDIISLAQFRRARVIPGLKRKIFEYKNWLDLRRYEYNIVKRFDKVVAMSGADKDRLLYAVPGLDISVIPNGVDTGYYKCPENSLKPRLTFMAGIKHYANTDAAEYLIKNIWPPVKREYPELQLYFLGNYPVEEEGDKDLSGKIKMSGITWTGLIQDTRPYLAGSIFVVPLRIASGTRLKILEAMSMGCAVISTSIGAEGILARPGEEILIADTAYDFTKCILKLLKDSVFRKEIGQKARALVENKYDWKDIVEIQERVYKELKRR
jgi:glycosyltransferase involved in cell wall biosynthesis